MEEEEKEETSTEETSTEESSASEEDKKTVPLERFNEVYGQLKDVKKEIESLKTKEAKTGLNPEEEKELKAQEYLQGLIEKTLSKREEQAAQAKVRAEKELKENIEETLSLNPDVKRTDFVKFLENEADKYGVNTVAGAMNLYRQINKTTLEANQKAKDELKKKPSSLSNEGTGGGKAPDDTGKTLRQIAEEAIRGLK